MNKSIIKRAQATPVVVPAKPDSLNSPGIEDEDENFAAKFKTGKAWTEFPNEVKWIIEVENENGLHGIGETYRGADGKDVRKSLESLIGVDVLTMNWREMPTDSARAYDGIESAVLDLAGKSLDVPVYQLLGGKYRARVECMGWTGRRTPDDAARKAYEAMKNGFRVFKFKCSDTDPVKAWIDKIQERCGKNIKVLLDPNQRWNDTDTTFKLMQGVQTESMYGLEDPVDRQDYHGYRLLKEKMGIPIFVHVSLPYRHQGQKAEDLIKSIKENCADGFNFNGPMFEFVRLAETAALEGLSCWHGSEVDLGILEVSALHAAAAASSCTIPSDLFGELVRVDDLLVEPIKFEKNFALVPDGPGLGVELDRAALEKYTSGEIIKVGS